MPQTDPTFWQDARNRHILLDPRKINLNSGTLQPTPRPVLAAADRFREMMVRNPSDFVWRQLPPLIQTARSRLAGYLHCDAADVLLLPNVTFAINLITSSLKLKPGDEILTTDHEYGAMVYAWNKLAERSGAKLRTIELPYRSEDPAEVVAAFEKGISDQTRVLFFSHVMTSTGLLVPAKELCELARRRGIISVVDGAHAPGTVPVDLSTIGADFYGANCHKWLMAPAGSGFLHVAPDRKSMITPIVISWGSAYEPHQAEQDSGNGGSRWQWDLEFHGTADRCPQMAIPAALDFRQSLGGDDAILSRMRELSNYARQALSRLRCATPRNDLLNCGALTAFQFPCDDVIKMRDRLWHEHHIECPITAAAGATFLRVSTAWFNTMDEIDALARAVRIIQG